MGKKNQEEKVETPAEKMKRLERENTHMAREIVRIKQENEILKRPWASSRNSRRALSIHSAISLHVFCGDDVQNSRSIEERFLRLVQPEDLKTEDPGLLPHRSHPPDL